MNRCWPIGQIKTNLWNWYKHTGIDFAGHILKCTYLKEQGFFILVKIFLTFIYSSLIDNESALFQAKPSCRTGNRPLPESLITQSIIGLNILTTVNRNKSCCLWFEMQRCPSTWHCCNAWSTYSINDQNLCLTDHQGLALLTLFYDKNMDN